MINGPTALGTKDCSGISDAFAENTLALDDFAARWRGGRLPKQSWTHAAHVAMAAYVAFDHSAEATFAQMKAGILHHNASVGTPNTEDSGYHETLTRFWCTMVGDFVRCGEFASRLDAVQAAVARFGADRKLPQSYYSFDLVSDRRARREWVLPDRQSRSGY